MFVSAFGFAVFVVSVSRTISVFSFFLLPFIPFIFLISFLLVFFNVFFMPLLS